MEFAVRFLVQDQYLLRPERNALGTVQKHPEFQNEAVDYSSDLSANITTTGLTHISAIQGISAKIRRARLAFGRYSFQIWTK
jgi:hypothetical protein